MVVHDNHQPHLCQFLNYNVEYFHGPLTLQLWVGRQVFVRYNRVVVVHLERIGKSDTVEPKLPNLPTEILQSPTLQPIHAVPAHMCTQPVDTAQLDSFATGVDDHGSLSAQRKFDVLHIEQPRRRKEFRFEFDQLREVEGIAFLTVIVSHDLLSDITGLLSCMDQQVEELRKEVLILQKQLDSKGVENKNLTEKCDIQSVRILNLRRNASNSSKRRSMS